MNTKRCQKWAWLVVPMLVLVGAFMLFPGSATQAQEGQSLDVHVVGIVESFDNSSLTVNGQLISSNDAEINVELAVDLPVRVEARLLRDGSLVAREVNAVDESSLMPGEVRLVGILESLIGNTMTVSGLSFDVSTASVDSTVAPGDTVAVFFSIAESDAWQVRAVVVTELDNSGDDTPGGDFKIGGTLAELGQDYIVVSGQTIDITGAEVSSHLVLGVVVEVEARRVDGTFLALRVRVSEDEDQGFVLPGDCTLPSGWTSYTAQDGDSLSEIASGAGTTTQVLLLANCFTDESVQAGDVLFVPQQPVIGNDDNGNDNSDNGNSNTNDNGDDNGNGNDNGDNGNSNTNDNVDDNGNDNSDNGNSNANDNVDDNGNDNGDNGNVNDNGDDNSGNSNDNGDDHGNDNSSDSNDNGDDD